MGGDRRRWPNAETAETGTLINCPFSHALVIRSHAPEKTQGRQGHVDDLESLATPPPPPPSAYINPSYSILPVSFLFLSPTPKSIFKASHLYNNLLYTQPAKCLSPLFSLLPLSSSPRPSLPLPPLLSPSPALSLTTSAPPVVVSTNSYRSVNAHYVGPSSPIRVLLDLVLILIIPFSILILHPFYSSTLRLSFHFHGHYTE